MYRLFFLLMILVSTNLFSQYSLNIPEKQTLNFPSVNEITISEIGNTMVTALEEEVFSDGFYLSDTVSWKALGAVWQIVPSDFYFFSSTPKGKFYVSINKCLNWQDALVKSSKQTYLGSIFVFNKEDKIRYGAFNTASEIPAQLFGWLKTSNNIKKDLSNKKQVKLISDKSFKQEFIFGGKVGSSVKFTYREYSGNLIRPSFTQEVQYDLNDGRVIGFKGLKIEILETDNLKIKYKVLSHFVK
jgi:hypothetical protein